MSKRLVLHFNEVDSAELTRLAETDQLSVEDLIRRSMRIGVWYFKEVASHRNRKLFLKKGRKRYQLVHVPLKGAPFRALD